MTGYKEALNWYFHWELSQIAGTELDRQLQEIFNPAISEADREILLRTLTEQHESSAIFPEYLFQVGAWYRKHGMPQKALKYWNLAIERHAAARDLHHMNTLRWIYGCILWQIGNNLEACLNWRYAVEVWWENLEFFQERQRTTDLEIENARLATLRCIEREEWHQKRSLLPGAHQAQHQNFIADYQRKAHHWQTKIGELKRTKHGLANKLEWYQQRLQEMEVALLCKPEEAYLLVKDMANLGQPQVCQGFIHQRDVLEALVHDRKVAQAVKEVERMLEAAAAWTPVEKAGSNLAGGWVFYVLKNEGWEKLLKKAVFLYPPDALGRVWARWLLGAIQWQIPEQIEDAATNWEIAIQDLDHLEKTAEWQNQGQLVNYYSDKITLMRAALGAQRDQLPVTQQAGI